MKIFTMSWDITVGVCFCFSVVLPQACGQVIRNCDITSDTEIHGFESNWLSEVFWTYSCHLIADNVSGHAAATLWDTAKTVPAAS